jgi:hypothetical protein
MIGLELTIIVRAEEYDLNGEKKKAYRIKAMKPAVATAPEEKPF